VPLKERGIGGGKRKKKKTRGDETADLVPENRRAKVIFNTNRLEKIGPGKKGDTKNRLDLGEAAPARTKGRKEEKKSFRGRFRRDQRE